MMITFSTSAIAAFPRFSLYSVARGGHPLHRYPLRAPALNGPPQLEVGDHARDHRQPEREGPEHEHCDPGQTGVDAERRKGADHAALDAADPAGERQQVAEHAEEEALHEHRLRRRVAEGVERGPQHADLEPPESD